jgi:hypothetical protein
MKRLFLMVLLLIVTSAFLFADTKNDKEFILKLGVQPFSSLEVIMPSLGMSIETSPNTGVSAGLECFQYLSNVVALGLGTQYDLPRRTAKENTEICSFMPVFAALKLRTPLSGLDNTFMFLSSRIGWNIPVTISDLPQGASLKIGFYYGAGIGVSIESFVIETIYAKGSSSVQANDATGNNVKISVNLETITLYAGYKFDL